MSERGADQPPIVIIGGGVIGCATAFFLKRAQPQVPVCVIERDPSYALASSALSASSIRQQFSSAINIAISAFGMQFLRDLQNQLGAHEPVDVGLHEGGYLYLGTAASRQILHDNHALQRRMGADVALLQPYELQARFAWLQVDDLALGSLGLSGEGWFDGYALLMALKNAARRLGVQFIHDQAVGFSVARSDGVQHITHVHQQLGEALACRAVLNAAGAWAATVAAWADIRLPVVGKSRTVFHVRCPTALPACPLLIDPSGIWLRPEGVHRAGDTLDPAFITGFTPEAAHDADFAPLEPNYAAFESHVWPTLAQRIPAFESLHLVRAWAGYYEMNTFDHNAILGLHPACDNLWFANGFSGHGLQQCPAVGRGIAEQLLTGKWQTLDLTPLGWLRILNQQPLIEKNII